MILILKANTILTTVLEISHESQVWAIEDIARNNSTLRAKNGIILGL